MPYICSLLRTEYVLVVARGESSNRASSFEMCNTCKLHVTLCLLDMGTKCSLCICIGKPCGVICPLTEGHDDNVFLNGLTQQAIQKDIAHLQMLPENLCSYQLGKGCSDATIVDGIAKEVAL
jgi:hypothetical protein